MPLLPQFWQLFLWSSFELRPFWDSILQGEQQLLPQFVLLESARIRSSHSFQESLCAFFHQHQSCLQRSFIPWLWKHRTREPDQLVLSWLDSIYSHTLSIDYSEYMGLRFLWWALQCTRYHQRSAQLALVNFACKVFGPQGRREQVFGHIFSCCSLFQDVHLFGWNARWVWFLDCESARLE